MQNIYLFHSVMVQLTVINHPKWRELGPVRTTPKNLFWYLQKKLKIL